MKTLKTLVICLVILLGMHSNALAVPNAQATLDILYVKTTGTSINSCANWADACDLQSALNYIGPAYEVWVAAGTYKPGTVREATFQLKNRIEVYGGFPDTGNPTWEDRDWVLFPTVLSGDIGTGGVIDDNSYHVVNGSGVDATAIMDGFTISGGNANGDNSPNDKGGGMYNDTGSPALTDVTFISNTARQGGGMSNFLSSPSLTNVNFNSNTAIIDGGGMYNINSSPTLTDVTFSSNTASQGGGMSNSSSSPILTGVTFNTNTATAGGGGGMYNTESSPELTDVTFSSNTGGLGGGMLNAGGSPKLTDVTFSDNTAADGGGMSNVVSSPSLTNVIFSGNSANSDGGGMYNNNSSSPTLSNVTFSGNTASFNGGGMHNYNNSSPTLINVTFSGNTADLGGGMHNYNNSSPTLTNMTFSGNTASLGGGIYVNLFCSVTIRNSIFWGNSIEIDPQGGGYINYSLIEGGCPSSASCDNIITGNPLLGLLADNGGFTLTHALGEGSPAIDTGDPSNCPATDQRGYYRPIDGDGNGTATCDMGAYEYGSALFLFLPLITR
ncbi:MAG: choice-of-anchor Q domain-containing protein [Anaerolineaceae bacterium]